MKRPSSPRRRGGVRLFGALCLSLASLSMISVGASSATSGSLCQKVSTAEISSTLGLKATKVATTVNGGVTVCWYQVGSLAHAVYVRSQTSTTKAQFTADRKSAGTYGEHPKTDTNFAPYSAFSTSLGSVTYGFTFSVTVLKKSTQLDVGGANTTLAKVETLAKKVLPLL